MMKPRNLLKNIGFFLLGALTWFIISSIWDWNGNVESFKDGYNVARNTNTEITK